MSTGTSLGAPALDVQTFTASGTYTKPAGMLKVRVQAWGGGASGGKPDADGGGGGGGGGAYIDILLEASDVSATETVTIASAAAAVTGAGVDGNVGGNCTFGSLVTGFGGAGALGERRRALYVGEQDGAKGTRLRRLSLGLGLLLFAQEFIDRPHYCVHVLQVRCE